MSLQLGMSMSLGSPISPVLGVGHDPDLSLLYQFSRTRSLQAVNGLGSTLDIVRIHEKYHYNSAGILVAVPAGEAAFDHDPITGVSLGLSIHEARTNDALFSRDMSNAAHVIVNGTKGSISVLDPTNTPNINVRLTATSSNMTLLQSVTSSSANRAFAPFIKRVTGSGNIQLTVDGGATWTTVIVTADWARLDINQLAVTDPQFGVRVVTSGDVIDYWGPDLQTGTFITPHIPTVAVPVLRNADLVKTTDMSWYNVAGNTIYVEASHGTGIHSGNNNTIAISDNSSSDRIIQFSTSIGAGSMLVASGGGVQANLSVASIFNTTDPVRQASAITLNDAETYFDGVRVGTGDQTVIMPIGITHLYIGAKHDSGGDFWNGNVGEVRGYNVPKPNQFLEDLTTGLIPA